MEKEKAVVTELSRGENVRYAVQSPTLRLDRIKIKAPLRCMVQRLTEVSRMSYGKNGELTGRCYISEGAADVPFNLFVGEEYPYSKLTIELSSKILGDDYPRLICKDTIRQCLNNLNKLGFCLVDVDGILEHGVIISMDVTCDYDFELTDEALNALSRQVQQYRRYTWRHYQGEGITFKRSVKAKDCKEAITIYNKGIEIEKTENRKFLKSLNNPQKIVDYFRGKTRFEVRLPTKKKIMSFLSVPDIRISTILNYEGNPIMKMFERIFGERQHYTLLQCSDYEEWHMRRLLDYYHGDLKQIESELRCVYSSKSRSGINLRMRKFAELWKAMQGETAIDYIDIVRKLLATPPE